MGQIRKYGFDTEFAPDGAIMREAPKRLSPEEVEAECAAAYERGKQDAVAQAERKAAAALEALADAASAVLTRLDTESKAMREEAARVAIAAARKIAGASLDAYGQERGIAAVDAAMDALRHQPRLVVRLPTADVAFLQPRIDTMTATHAYAGAVLVRGDDTLRAGEVVIDWSDGCVRMSPDEALERINTLVDAALSAPAPQS
jgi:flagellar assembly protein FliH